MCTPSNVTTYQYSFFNQIAPRLGNECIFLKAAVCVPALDLCLSFAISPPPKVITLSFILVDSIPGDEA